MHPQDLKIDVFDIQTSVVELRHAMKALETSTNEIQRVLKVIEVGICTGKKDINLGVDSQNHHGSEDGGPEPMRDNDNVLPGNDNDGSQKRNMVANKVHEQPRKVYVTLSDDTFDNKGLESFRTQPITNDDTSVIFNKSNLPSSWTQIQDGGFKKQENLKVCIKCSAIAYFYCHGRATLIV